MTAPPLAQVSRRTHAIVEGALLGDIAIVFLLMQVYLPVPPIRVLLRSIAAVPFVMLTQRRGIKIAILASIASYILFSAIVGPLLALVAIDVAVAALLAAIARKSGLWKPINMLWTGPLYATLDLILPTVATVILFRYPVKKLIESAHNFVRLAFNFLIWLLTKFHAPASAIHQLNVWKTPVADHWQLVWVGMLFAYGILTMYLILLVSDMVLKQIPEETLEAQKAA